jgi:hypothetical protein
MSVEVLLDRLPDDPRHVALLRSRGLRQAPDPSWDAAKTLPITWLGVSLRLRHTGRVSGSAEKEAKEDGEDNQEDRGAAASEDDGEYAADDRAERIRAG